MSPRIPPPASALLAILRNLDETDVLPDHHHINPDDTSCPVGRAFGAWRRAGYPGATTSPAYTLVVEPDPEPESPADWIGGDTRCFIEARHRRFVVGLTSAQSEALAEGLHRRIPLFACIHGGVLLFLDRADAERAAGAHAGWDTGQIGWIHLGPINAENPDPDTLATDIVEAWNTYLRGDVWCWRALDADGEEVESLSNCYGEAQARAEGEAALRSLLDPEPEPLVSESAYDACMAALSDPSGPRTP